MELKTLLPTLAQTVTSATEETGSKFLTFLNSDSISVQQDSEFDGGETILHSEHVITPKSGKFELKTGWKELGYDVVGLFNSKELESELEKLFLSQWTEDAETYGKYLD